MINALAETGDVPHEDQKRGRSRAKNNGHVRSPLEQYLHEINEMPLLTAEAEKELADRIQAGDEAAFDHLVRANLRLVVNIARSYLGKGLSLQDCIQEGNDGLMTAARQFSSSFNTKFSTYATYWIKQSIKAAIINQSKTIRIPAWAVAFLSQWRSAEQLLEKKLGRHPYEHEVSEYLKIKKTKMPYVRAALKLTSGQPVQPDEENDILSTVEGKGERSPLVEAERRDSIRRMQELMLTELDVRERTILSMRHGLGDGNDHELEEIGVALGITRERVRQIEAEAISKLGAAMGIDTERYSLVAGQNATKSARALLASTRKAALKPLLVHLNAHERELIHMRYGFDKQQPQTVSAIAVTLSLPEMQIEQTLAEARSILDAALKGIREKHRNNGHT